MAGISVPVPSVDDGAIVAALHIVWALRGRGRNPREPQRRILAIRPFSNVVLAGGRECSVERDAIKAKRTQFQIQCRAHLRGRCINGNACQHAHSTNPAEILCNSMITTADKGISSNNKTYGYCHLFDKNMACPYKDCIHGLTLTPPEHEQQMGDGGEPPAEEMEVTVL